MVNSNITDVDISNNYELRYFRGAGQLTYLDLSSASKLEVLNLSLENNESLEKINLTNGVLERLEEFCLRNLVVFCGVCVDDVDFAVNNFTNVDAALFQNCNEDTTLSQEEVDSLVVIYPVPITGDSFEVSVGEVLELVTLVS